MSSISKNLARQALSFIADKKFDEINVVRFEGGLGSQLLSYFEYWISLKKSDSSTYANLDYFTSANTQTRRWGWELSNYGLDLIQLRDYASFSPLLKYKSSGKLTWATEQSWRQIKSEMSKQFQVDLPRVSSQLQNLKIGGDYGVLHIRRGDYLQVASKILSLSAYIEVLNKVKKLIPKDLVIISDSKVPDEFLAELRNLYCPNISVLDNPELEPRLLHDVMRKSKLLISGNSTFSFTAGLLADEECVVVVPMDFYNRPELEYLNANYRNSGQFFIQDV